MNLRAQTTMTVLNSVIKTVKPDRFNIIEIGCMFNEREGLSTYKVAQFIKESTLNPPVC